MENIKKRRDLDMELEAPADFTSPEELYQELITRIRRYHPSDDISMIEKAYKVGIQRPRKDRRENQETVHYPSVVRCYYSGNIRSWYKANH